MLIRENCQICDPLLTATRHITSRLTDLCLLETTQITDFSTENSSERIKQFAGHEIKVNMF